MIDVLVAGGGPAGLATAIRCARAGLSVTVAEPRSGPADKACGEGLMPAAVARLADLGVRRPAGRPLLGIRYLDPGHRADALFRDGGGLGVRRTVLHAALAARAAELAIPVRAARITGFRQDRDQVTARCHVVSGDLDSGDMASGEITARYLVAADGLHSPLRRACGLDPPPARHRRYGLRRHYRMAPWSSFVEVYWGADAEAYVTPVADDMVGVAVLGSGGSGGFESRLAAFPALLDHVAGAAPASDVRGAGPLRQDVRRRVAGRVLLAGDAAGYLDALTGEGIGAALAEAEVLAACLAAGRPENYEHAWRRVTRKSRVLTSGLLWSRQQALLGQRIVPAAQRLPRVFTAIVNQVGAALAVRSRFPVSWHRESRSDRG
jgi:flavin-dependent dehydrogenase